MNHKQTSNPEQKRALVVKKRSIGINERNQIYNKTPLCELAKADMARYI